MRWKPEMYWQFSVFELKDGERSYDGFVRLPRDLYPSFVAAFVAAESIVANAVLGPVDFVVAPTSFIGV